MTEHARVPVTIRPYRVTDERQWLRCSALAFLETAYFDSVFREKPRYEHPAIELVAECDETIAGIIDVEYEIEPGTVCTACAGETGAMIWHLAVHPDFQRQGIGAMLLTEARRLAEPHGITCFEAWTRDDEPTLRWYRARGFERMSSYLHVYLQDKREMDGVLSSAVPRLTPVHAFCHYTGPDADTIRKRFARVHECTCFRLWL